jgi:hypothetical protein
MSAHQAVLGIEVVASPAVATFPQVDRLRGGDKTAAASCGDVATPVTVGRQSPLGATVTENGVNFSLYSRAAGDVELLLFDRENDEVPSRVIPLDRASHRTYHYWHVFVPGLRAGQLYGYRVHGPSQQTTTRFDAEKVLLDPYGRGTVIPDSYNREAATHPGVNTATSMKSVVVDPHAYDWEGDVPLHRPAARTVIYEMHVRGFTRNPNSGVGERTRGTYAGLIEKIPYLQSLGVTAVELLPVLRSIPTPARRDSSITGAISRFRSSRRTPRTARVAVLSARPTSSATWSRHCTAQGSRSFWMSSSIIRPKAITPVRCSAFAASTPRPITS